MTDTRTAPELEHLRHKYGYAYRRGVLVEDRGGTALVESLVADARGVLVIESRDWAGQQVKGSSEDPSWTVLRAGLTAATYPNPLLRNAAHAEAVRAALATAGVALPPDAVRGIVVLPDIDLATLELVAADRSRVVRLGELDAFFAERRDATGPSPLAGVDPTALPAALAAIDRSEDEATRAAHEASRVRPKLTTGAAVPPSRGPAPALIWGLAGVAAVMALALAGWAAWSAVDARRATTDIPPVPVPVPVSTPAPSPAPVEPAPEPEAPTPSVDVPLAIRLLREHAPGTAKRVSDLAHPDTERLPDRMLYTWDYVSDGTASGAIKVHTVTVSVLADGSYAGITFDR